MTTYVALLYSVVVDQKRRVHMSDLRAIAESLGYKNARTLVSSGNVIFEADQTALSEIEKAFERAFADFHGKHVDIIVRTADEWKCLVASNPFPAESKAEPDRVSIRIMRDPLRPDLAAFLQPYQTDGERVALIDGHVWVHYPGQISLSKLAGQLTPKRMGGVGTARNWNTVKRLGEMLD
jgi:uncharacterized protein (DUF1697 family)